MKELKSFNKSKWTECVFIFIACGMGGFIYETLLCLIEQHILVKRGITYGPWITIYAIGGFAILQTTAKKCRKPWSLFITSTIASGIVKLIGGWILDKFFNLRIWDYRIDSPSWSFMNINGYISLRSIVSFGILVLIFRYAIQPLIEKAKKQLGERNAFIVSIVLTATYLLDLVVTFCM